MPRGRFPGLGRPRMLRWTAWALLGLGLVLMGTGAAPYAKGWVGQLLLERAWAEARAGETDPRPWPWADTRPLARLTLPELGVDAIILDGANGRTLAWGPGHLAGSAPIGTPGAAVLSAHRDSHFRFLEAVEPGMRFSLETADGRRLGYRVTGTEIVDSRQRVFIPQLDGLSTVTLVTCWPFDAPFAGTPWRYLVHAVPVGEI